MNKKGVTLIELIIVMVIIGIGAVFFIPNISGWQRSYNLRKAARDIACTMRTAQMKAIGTNSPYQVSFTLPTSYVLQYNDTQGNTQTEGTTQTLPSGISIIAVNFTGAANVAVFYTNSTANAGSRTFQNIKGTPRTLMLTKSTGRVTISQPGG
jgi:prepilin-type N-terminal cleavage/methylation domain-containing protein